MAEIDYLDEMVDEDSLNAVQIATFNANKQVKESLFYLTKIERENLQLTDISVANLDFALHLLVHQHLNYCVLL